MLLELVGRYLSFEFAQKCGIFFVEKFSFVLSRTARATKQCSTSLYGLMASFCTRFFQIRTGQAAAIDRLGRRRVIIKHSFFFFMSTRLRKLTSRVAAVIEKNYALAFDNVEVFFLPYLSVEKVFRV